MTYLDDVPDVGALVPAGTYVADVEDVEKGMSREKSKLMYSPSFRIVEPEGYIDMPLYDNFTIGSDGDPGAQSEETWKASVGARRFKQLVKASQVDLDNVDGAASPEEQTDQIIELIKGQRVVLSVDVEIDDGSRDPRFKDRKRNRVTGYYPLGTREAGTEAIPVAKTPLTRPIAPKLEAPRPAPRSQATTVVRPVRPSAPGRVVPRATPPPAKVANRPAPVAPSARTAAPAGKSPKAQVIKCEECVALGADATQMCDSEVALGEGNGALVTRADFPAHIDGHGEE